MKRLFKKAPLSILTGILLMAVAIYHGYPLVNSDSNTYISSGFTLTIPNDRPITYGLFLRLFSLGYSMWMPVFAQCCLLGWLLLRFFKARVQGFNYVVFILLLLITVACTSASWYASMLMPDIFVAILGLALLNYYCNDNSNKQDNIYLGLMLLAALMHNSHLIILSSFSLLMMFLGVVSKTPLYPFKKSFRIFLFSVVGWLVLCSTNLLGGHTFTPSREAPVFLVGKLGENGVLSAYLKDKCPSKDYVLCRHRDYFPTHGYDYMWNADSPLQLEGGWEKNRQECADIVDDIITTPKYLLQWLLMGMEDMIKEIMMTDLDYCLSSPDCYFDNISGIYPTSIAKHVPADSGAFLGSKQLHPAKGKLPHNFIFQSVILLSSCIVVFISLKKGNRAVLSIYVLLMLFLLVNAFTVANFANVLERLNSRVIWLLPVVNLVMIYSMLMRKQEQPAV